MCLYGTLSLIWGVLYGRASGYDARLEEKRENGPAQCSCGVVEPGVEPLLLPLLGVQGNVWTEHIRTPERLFYMAFPRAKVMADAFFKAEHVGSTEK